MVISGSFSLLPQRDVSLQRWEHRQWPEHEQLQCPTHSRRLPEQRRWDGDKYDALKTPQTVNYECLLYILSCLFIWAISYVNISSILFKIMYWSFDVQLLLFFFCVFLIICNSSQPMGIYLAVNAKCNSRVILVTRSLLSLIYQHIWEKCWYSSCVFVSIITVALTMSV